MSETQESIDLKGLYRVECALGVALCRARNERQARKYMTLEYGRDAAPYDIQQATEHDYRYVTGFGGIIHDALAAARGESQ